MKKLIWFAIVIFVFQQAHSQIEKTYDLEVIIEKINLSLDEASKEIKGIKIDNAKITLKTSYSKEGGGGFKFFAKANHSWEAENANEIVFEYFRPEDRRKDYTKGADKIPIDKQLKDAIVSAGNQWINVTSTIADLEKKQFEVTVNFAVTKETSAGIEFEILGVGLDLGGDYSKTVVHSISLTFKSA